MTGEQPDALDVAAKATGLRPDQVREAVREYRAAAAAIDTEPDWSAIMHMSGGEFALAQYGAEGTAVVLTIESWKERGEWKSERRYVFGESDFEFFSEAKAAELAASACPKPHTV